MVASNPNIQFHIPFIEKDPLQDFAIVFRGSEMTKQQEILFE